MTVLDASAVLAYLLDEPGAELVADRLPGSLLSAVNAAEILSRLYDRGMDSPGPQQMLVALGCEVVDFDSGLAEASAELRAATRSQGLSLGDRACLALSIREDAPVLTADRIWSRLPLDLTIEVLRP